ncbi:MAG: DUF3565 domain-containing protein [Ardenticatenaceae bacterium]|nr:DUF3565 domain-containing protein [Ardenticatenaceae bacterium]
MVAIVGFHQDEVGDWVADFSCGHRQHMRHNPPLTDRPWVLTETGRGEFIGRLLVCKQCQDEREANTNMTTDSIDYA